jgi:hypothetical protein
MGISPLNKEKKREWMSRLAINIVVHIAQVGYNGC